MFRRVSQHLFWWPVTVRMPDPAEAGKFDEQTFEMQFEALSMDRARQMDQERATRPAAERDPFDFLSEICRGWRDVEDDNGVSVPFTWTALEEQLRFPWFRDAVLTAYGQATSGEAPRLGN